jgi:putative tricarboxylic transport membrane protein
MSLRIKSQKDFNAGLLFIIMGLGFAIVARNYPMGTAVRMGPAYFPTVLGYLLAILGLIVFLRSFVSQAAPPSPTQPRGLLWILGSVVAFALLVGPFNAGLVPASLVIVVMSAYGGKDFGWRESIISSVLQTTLCVGVFYYGLGLPFRLFPWS